jgi:hypothetical protein
MGAAFPALFVYHQSQMRRVLSILLVLFFGIGPLPASFGAGDDARLPVCCRRHGTHHCAMGEEGIAGMVRGNSGSTAFLSAPPRCPMYPGDSPATTSPVHALARYIANSTIPLVERYTSVVPQAVRCNGEIHTHTGRGPPSPIPA